MKLKSLIRGILNENLTLRSLTLSDLESVAMPIRMTGINQLNVDLPNAEEGLIRIDLNSSTAQSKLDDYKRNIAHKVDSRKEEGSVLDSEVILNPDEVWFNKITIDDEDFRAEKNRSVANKRAWIDSEREQGRTFGLDESSEGLNEAKMPNEPFVKVEFEYEFPSNEKRKELMDIIRSHFGEPLGKSREEQYWSTYVPKLELKKFLNDAMEFNPVPSGVEIQANRFKPLTKGLQEGDIITFYDYTVSENNPPRAEGKLKFVYNHLSLLKWDGNKKEAMIKNSMIDKYYFYHGDVSDIKEHPKSRSIDNEKYTKIFLDDAMLDKMNANQEDELRNIITAHKGQLRYVFGKERASGGQRYTMIPRELADDFIQAAYDFGAYDAETERNIYLEDKALNEIRKIVRGVINKVVK